MSLYAGHTTPSIKQIEGEINAAQTVCYTCGKPLTNPAACPVCGERQCSQACCDRHVRDMDAI